MFAVLELGRVCWVLVVWCLEVLLSYCCRGGFGGFAWLSTLLPCKGVFVVLFWCYLLLDFAGLVGCLVVCWVVCLWGCFVVW